MSELQQNSLNLKALKNSAEQKIGEESTNTVDSNKFESGNTSELNNEKPIENDTLKSEDASITSQADTGENKVASEVASEDTTVEDIKEKETEEEESVIEELPAISKISLKSIKKDVTPLSKGDNNFIDKKETDDETPHSTSEVAGEEIIDPSDTSELSPEEAQQAFTKEDNLIRASEEGASQSIEEQKSQEEELKNGENTPQDTILPLHTVDAGDGKEVNEDHNTNENKNNISKTPQNPIKPEETEKVQITETTKTPEEISRAFVEETLSDEEQNKIVEETLGKKGEKKKKRSRGLFGFLKKKKKGDSDSEKTEVEKSEEEKKDEEVHFENYTSTFEKQTQNLLTRIQNFKYTPTTRKGLVISLILFTVGIIGTLMIFFPEKHSVSVYKASILEMVSPTQEDPIINQPIIDTPVEIPDESQQDTNEDTELPGDDQTNDIISESEIEKLENDKQQIKNYIIDRYNAKR